MSATESRRSETRSTRAPGEHAEVVHSTLHALVEDVNKTTELIRRRREQQLLDKKTFQSEMEVKGKIYVEPQEDWLTLRLKSVSTEDLRKELGKVKDDQRQHAVTDTLAALVYDVNATAEVLRRGSLKRKKPKVHEEVEYRLHLAPAQDDSVLYHHEEEKQTEPFDDSYTLESVKKDYGVQLSESQTDTELQGSPPPGAIPICAYCSQEIDGAVLTALAPNAARAQKFHPFHFMCCYCQKALNLRGTYREHNLRPYCHECFYKLYNGLMYEPDDNQRKIEKLI